MYGMKELDWNRIDNLIDVWNLSEKEEKKRKSKSLRISHRKWLREIEIRICFFFNQSFSQYSILSFTHF